MRMRRRENEQDGFTTPPAESIDEALARLARQDARLDPDGPATPQMRAVAAGRASRDRVWVALRWLIILGLAWAIWRFAVR
jgi:hypothetical protein